MKMIIMAVLIAMVAGAGVSFATTLYLFRCWMAREEERRRRARRLRKAKAVGREERLSRDAFSLRQAGEGRAPETTIALFPTEKAKVGKGRIRGAYKGPDGSVTYIGIEGVGADA